VIFKIKLKKVPESEKTSVEFQIFTIQLLKLIEVGSGSIPCRVNPKLSKKVVRAYVF